MAEYVVNPGGERDIRRFTATETNDKNRRNPPTGTTMDCPTGSFDDRDPRDCPFMIGAASEAVGWDGLLRGRWGSPRFVQALAATSFSCTVVARPPRTRAPQIENSLRSTCNRHAAHAKRLAVRRPDGVPPSISCRKNIVLR